ncbi:zinc finger 598 [Olea europaea subsp. europaea]|uniref:Zinc finger 598 n=1 Tax=Olea europaea subsp. europaea TaxID=158383 RepID=A0A8S0PPT7_OLEEU|nr:zinc finger 598 [Olea europaea subsp. europaea]
MDDTCVTCAEILDWVAYGPCGHRDVCSTCVARSRFISHDRCCSICKTPSNVVFVTKDLGEYTKRVGDFSVLPSDVEEGRVGNYWYHEGTQAFFDDSDHYKMIKAMCELSCSVCDGIDKSRRKEKFKDIEELKGHLFHKHKLFMCSMCLEGKKVFICEQKLYTRAQLTRHINRGDEEVDGTEIDQGDFMGHPICEFCSIPFYGESELYTHMSTEHHTCRMCLRQDAGQYEYYKNFSDLEAHFRRYHFLCEDEECLTKKFVVFLSEHELKLHAQEHEQDSLRRTECSCQHNTKDNELSLATQVSLETSNAAPSSTGVDSDRGEISNDNTHFPPLESLAITDFEPSLKCFQAMSQISFPPLPVAPCSSQQNGHFHASQTSFPLLPVVPCSSQQNTRSAVLPKNTMASHLGRQRNNKMKIFSPVSAWTPRNLNPAKPAIIPPHPWPSVNSAYGPLSSTRQNVTATENRPTPSSYAAAAKAHQSSRNCGNLSWDSYSTSSHILSGCVSFDPLITEFPPVSAMQTCKLPATVKKVKDVYTTNKSLVEKIRLALGFDENRYSTFKTISSEYRQGLMDAETYLVYMEQYGLLHLVHELVGLLPDERRQKELVETYNANLVDTARRENGWNNESLVKNDQRSKKDKGMSHDSRSNISKHNVIGTVKEVSAGYSRSQQDFEELSKEGYRVVKSKSKTLVEDSQEELSKHGKSAKLKSCGAGSIQNFESGNGKRKQRKKSRSIRTNGPTAFA